MYRSFRFQIANVVMLSFIPALEIPLLLVWQLSDYRFCQYHLMTPNDKYVIPRIFGLHSTIGR